MLFAFGRQLALEPFAGRRGGKAAERRFAELDRHTPPDLAHRVDDLIDGDAALDARERHIRRAHGVDRADDMDERQVSREASMAKMLTTWQAMQDAADSYTGRKRSVSGLVGGDGMKMRQYTFRGCAMTGGYVSEVIAEALSMAESNACMRRIVAAPTAGACGVLPAVLLPLCKYEELTQHQLLEALYVAAGIGSIIAYKASIAGASGGCQAEIGTASAMAAGALVALRGGEGEQIGHAVAMALKNLMGLVCD